VKSLLQTITDLLEAGSIPVLGIDTYPPEKDGEIAVSLRVRFPGGPIGGEGYISWAAASVAKFLDDYVQFDEAFSETVDAVFNSYREIMKWYGVSIPFEGANDSVTRIRFMRLVTKYFPKCETRHMRKPGGEPVLCFMNLRLSDKAPPWETPDPSGETPAVDKNQKLMESIQSGETLVGDCHNCLDDCETCPVSPANSLPIDLYSPEEAVMAMLGGKILKDAKGRIARYKAGSGFTLQDQSTGSTWYITDFSGLYSDKEESHV